MDDEAYLRRREQQERVAALQANCPGARAAHLHMADLYRERLRARRIAHLRLVLNEAPSQRRSEANALARLVFAPV
jgi:hypothetical protein